MNKLHIFLLGIASGLLIVVGIIFIFLPFRFETAPTTNTPITYSYYLVSVPQKGNWISISSYDNFGAAMEAAYEGIPTYTTESGQVAPTILQKGKESYQYTVPAPTSTEWSCPVCSGVVFGGVFCGGNISFKPTTFSGTTTPEQNGINGCTKIQ